MSICPFFACIHFHILILFQGAPCAAAPCVNGATCSNHGKDYKCTCAAGYTGKQCEIRSKYKYFKCFRQNSSKAPLYDPHTDPYCCRDGIAEISYATEMSNDFHGVFLHINSLARKSIASAIYVILVFKISTKP